MPTLFETFPVERSVVETAMAEHWGLKLDEKPLKASQNVTYRATDEHGKPCAVRVTPDPRNEQHGRILKEVAFVSYLQDKLDGVCGPVASKTGELALRVGDYSIVVFAWAQGSPLDFMAYRWATDAVLIEAWGAWMARQHAAARAFAAAHPEALAGYRAWDDLHDGLMRGTQLHPDDAAIAKAGPSDEFCLLHGDLNLSNFFVVDEAAPAGVSLSVFDWDQLHFGWPLWDVAQAANAVTMLAEGGSLPAGDPVPQANPAAFLASFIRGYESVAGAGAVDRPRLDRMIALRRSFYWKFAARALAEGDPPADMAWFLEYVARWQQKVEAAQRSEGAGGSGGPQ